MYSTKLNNSRKTTKKHYNPNDVKTPQKGIWWSPEKENIKIHNIISLMLFKIALS